MTALDRFDKVINVGDTVAYKYYYSGADIFIGKVESIYTTKTKLKSSMLVIKREIKNHKGEIVYVTDRRHAEVCILLGAIDASVNNNQSLREQVQRLEDTIKDKDYQYSKLNARFDIISKAYDEMKTAYNILARPENKV